MNVSIIIPAYNNASLLKENFPFVVKAAQKYCRHHKTQAEIIIVDDHSKDTTKEVVSLLSNQDTPSIQIRFFTRDANHGFSSTINYGVEQSQYEYLILLNTDVLPRENFLEPLLTHFSDKEVFAVGCMDESIEGNNVVLRGRGIGSWQKGFLMHNAGNVHGMTTLWVSGGSGAFRKTLWQQLGGFDQIYNPFYWEDIDISYRALKSGYKIIFEPKSVVTHSHQQGSIKTTYSEFKIKTIAYRNQFVFIWKNIFEWKLLFSHMLWFPYHLMHTLAKKDVAFALGFLYALLLLPRIVTIKTSLSKKFTKTDTEILQLVMQ